MSWQAVNDLSAHPSATGQPYNYNTVILNTLADLTNRENRPFYQRFSSDFQDVAGNLAPGGDGLTDDFNGDNVPDYYPTLYPQAFNYAAGAAGQQLIFEPGYPVARQPVALASHGFPLRLPRSLLQAPETEHSYAYGWIHSPDPVVPVNGNPVQFDQASRALNYLQNINHNPSTPVTICRPRRAASQTYQTQWSFPTWRETLSLNWQDPTYPVNGCHVASHPSINLAAGQPAGLASRLNDANATLPADLAQFLPAMTSPPRSSRNYSTMASDRPPSSSKQLLTLWNQYSWEDDLIMTGVRSFDIKAYDNSLAAYADLGWGDDLRNYPLTTSQNPNHQTNLPFLSGTPNPNLVGNPGFTGLTPYLFWNNQWYRPDQPDLRPRGPDAAPGRRQPLRRPVRGSAVRATTERRIRTTTATWATTTRRWSVSAGSGIPGPPSTAVAPGTGVYPAASPAANFPAGPPFAPPIYPSYPPPYPAPCGASRSRSA